MTATLPSSIPALAPSAFVGREVEVETLTRVLDAARSGSGRVVLASGEAGIGKTRLVDELARLASAGGFDVFVGRCYEVEGAPAFWPWIQVLRALVRQRQTATFAAELGAAASDLAALVPELGAPVTTAVPNDPAVARFLLFEGVAALLRHTATSRPLVIALDDLHRADTPSLRLLEFLVPHLRDVALVVLATFRDSPHDLDHPIASTLGEVTREASTVRLPLRGLSRDAVAELIAVVTGGPPEPDVIRTIHARTEGNPLFVTEIARCLVLEGERPVAGLDAMSAEMRTTIGRHVREASPACVDVLTAAAVFGRELRTDALIRVIGTTHDEMQTLLVEASRRQLVTTVAGDSRRVRFTHVLTRDVLYDAIPSPERPGRHRRAAEALAAVTAGDPEPPLAEIAAQFHRANDARAVDYARAAGDAAARLHAYEEAAGQYALAVAAAERAPAFDAALHCDLLLALGEAQRGARAFEAAKRTVLRAMESARHRGVFAQRARAALAYGVDFYFGEAAALDPVLVGLLAEAIEAGGERDDPVLVRLLGRMAHARYFDPTAAADREALTARAVAMARRLGDRLTLAQALLARHVATWRPDSLHERLALAREAIDLLPPSADPRIVFEAHALRAADHVEANDFVTADLEFAACAGIAEGSRHPYLAFMVPGFRALRATVRGDFAAAASFAATAAELAHRWFPELARAVDLMTRVGNARRRADWGAFEAPLRAATQMHPGAPALRALLAFALVELDRLDEARTELGVLASKGFDVIPDDVNALFTISLAADVCVAVGDAQNAEPLYCRLAPHGFANTIVMPPFTWRGSIAHRLGALARMLGRADDAATHFEDALAAYGSAGALPWLATTQYEYAVLLGTRGRDGDEARANTLLGQAEATAGRLGLETLLERVTAQKAAYADREPAPDEMASERAVFRREGESFVVTYAGRTVQLRATRGLEYLAPLLHAPLRELHVTELVAPASGGRGTAGAGDPSLRRAASLGDAGLLLDADAHAAYRTRLAALAEEVADAERVSDLGRIARARDERDALVDELSRAGRGRRAASHVERARVTVTKGLAAAVTRIRAVHPALAEHLSATLRRGYVCVYVPDPRHPIRWEA